MSESVDSQPNPVGADVLAVQEELEPLKLCDTASNASSLDILSTFKSPVAQDLKVSNLTTSPSFAENDKREYSTVLDQSHVERVSSFVRRHRQESISLTSGKKRLSWLSLSGTENLKPETLSRTHTRNYSTGGQIMPFEGRSPRHQNLQTASSLLSASPYIPALASSEISLSPSQDFQFPTMPNDPPDLTKLNTERDEEPMEELQNKSPIETELLALPTQPAYMALDPQTFSRALFEGKYEFILKDSPAQTLGRKDEFHSLALQAYMDNFDFENLTLDRAFHKVCEKLDFVGETQVMDRILFQIARRHWDCNPRSRNFFRTIDIAYGILFSLVLLNTDLHIANVGEKEVNQMNKKQFVKNTMDLIESMLKSDITAQKSWKSSQEKKAWKKNLEIELKKLYEIIRTGSLFQRDSSTSETRTSITSDDASSIARTSSTWSLSSGMSSGSVFSSASSTARSKRNPFGILKRTFFRPGPSLRLSTSAEKVSTPMHPSSGREIIFQGELIRKHLLEKKDVKAKNRRWYKFWSILVVSSDGVDLVMNSTDSKKIPLNYSEGSIFSASNPPSATSHLSAGFLSRSSTEKFSLLHSISKTLRPMSYSSKRPFVFQLTLANGSVYLFHVQSNQLMEEWVRQLNYHAARKSKEPLRDVLSSTDYGWNKIEWSRKKAEIDNTPVERQTPLAPGEKVELGTWEPPSSSFGHVLVSHLDEVAQVARFKNEIEVIRKEISTHNSYKEPIRIIFGNSSWLEKALSNWERKRKYLEFELHKYTIYVESLSAASTKSAAASGLDLVNEVEDTT